MKFDIIMSYKEAGNKMSIMRYDDNVAQKENIIYSRLHFLFVFIGMFVAVPLITILLVSIVDLMVVYPLHYIARLFS